MNDLGLEVDHSQNRGHINRNIGHSQNCAGDLGKTYLQAQTKDETEIQKIETALEILKDAL